MAGAGQRHIVLEHAVRRFRLSAEAIRCFGETMVGRGESSEFAVQVATTTEILRYFRTLRHHHPGLDEAEGFDAKRIPTRVFGAGSSQYARFGDLRPGIFAPSQVQIAKPAQLSGCRPLQ